MFKKYVNTLILGWWMIVIGGIAILYLFPSDAEISYQRLISYSDQAKKERLQENDKPAQQFREKVSKQIFYKKGDARLEIFLTGEKSELIYSKKDGELVERFKGLDCIMQEELMSGSDQERVTHSVKSEQELLPNRFTEQMIRGIKAQEAVYSYKNGNLEAQEMEVAHYLLPGHQCPHSLKGFYPLFKGKAYRSQISLLKEPNMQAEGFQAIFHDLESVW